RETQGKKDSSVPLRPQIFVEHNSQESYFPCLWQFVNEWTLVFHLQLLLRANPLHWSGRTRGYSALRNCFLMPFRTTARVVSRCRSGAYVPLSFAAEPIQQAPRFVR